MDYLLLLLLGIIIFVLLVAVALRPKIKEKRQIKKSGNDGETAAYVFLRSQLPADYTVIRNKIIYYDGRKSETDLIVIGETGVFIIEVKNIKGTVRGNYYDKNLVQYKVDQWGEEHIKSFYNPVKQVGTHIYRLSHYLADNGLKTYINGAVYFANPQAKLRIEDLHDEIPVLRYKNNAKLIGYILNGDKKLSDAKIEKIVKLLKK